MQNTINEGLTVTQQTANYVTALHALQTAASAFVVALWEHYGEPHGDDIYQSEAAAAFDQIQNKIAEYMAISITEAFGNQEKPTTI